MKIFSAGTILAVPPVLAHAIDHWCQRATIANTSLSSKGATADDPLDVYYIALSTKSGRDELKRLMKALKPEISKAVATVAAQINENIVLTQKGNDPFDLLIELSVCRNALMRFRAKPPKSEYGDPALIIGV